MSTLINPMRWVLLSTLVACLLVYIGSLHNGFVNLDDTSLLLENPIIRQIDLTQLFQRIVDRDYLPLTFFSYAIEVHFFGFEPFYFHLTNVILHILNSLLLVLLLRKMFELNPLVVGFVSILFAVHPLHVESVAWVSERKDVLSTFFFLLSLLCYAFYSKDKKWVAYVLSFSFLLLSLLSKAMAVTLPALLLLYDWTQIRHTRKSIAQILIEKIPFALLAAYFAVIHLSLRTNNFTDKPEYSTLSEHAQNIFTSLIFYLDKMWIPLKLSAFYQKGAVEVTSIQWIIGGLSLAGLLYMAWRFRRSKEILFGLGFFFITLAPVLRVVTFGSDFLYADRFMYIPSIGLFLAIGLALPLSAENSYRKITLIFLSACILVNGYLAFERTKVWASGETLWKDALVHYPKTKSAYLNLGVIEQEAGRLERATEYFKQVLKIDPNHVGALTNLASILYDTGKKEEAIEIYKTIFKIEPTNGDAHHNLGIIYRDEKQFDLAIQQFKECIVSNPFHKLAHASLGAVLHSQKRELEALEPLKVNVMINPQSPSAHLNLGVVYLHLIMWTQAESEFRKALELRKNYEQAFYGILITQIKRKNEVGMQETIRRAQQVGIALDVEKATKDLATILGSAPRF